MKGCLWSSKSVVNVSRCVGCYPLNIGKEFLLGIFAVKFNEAKTVPLKIGLTGSGVYYVSKSSCTDCYTLTIGKYFLIFSLVLPITMGKVFCILQVSVSRCMDF